MKICVKCRWTQDDRSDDVECVLGWGNVRFHGNISVNFCHILRSPVIGLYALLGICDQPKTVILKPFSSIMKGMFLSNRPYVFIKQSWIQVLCDIVVLVKRRFQDNIHMWPFKERRTTNTCLMSQLVVTVITLRVLKYHFNNHKKIPTVDSGI